MIKETGEIPETTFFHKIPPSPYDITPIENRRDFHIKPFGGIWVCPSSNEYRWKDWIDSEMRHATEWWEGKKEWTLPPANGKFAVIDSLDDLITLLSVYEKEKPFEKTDYTSWMFDSLVDWEKMEADGWDGVWVTENGQWATRLSEPNLYGWDLEAILVFRWVWE